MGRAFFDIGCRNGWREAGQWISRTRITGVSTDSQSVRSGDLFIALTGDRFDGHDFAEMPCRRGRLRCSSSNTPADSCKSAAVVIVENTRRALQDGWRRDIGMILSSRSWRWQL